mmetsp:Transcript_12342/g.24815  ORF Transcript_12342/g.24815 Transcript_12342/m.24815 type:complete len:432 (+) Transcript_12342:198-1493(+)
MSVNGGSMESGPPLAGVVIEEAGAPNSVTVASEPGPFNVNQDDAIQADQGCRRHMNGEENMLTTYCSRERMHLERERTGEVTASYVTNDGQPQSSKTLIGLKNIFSKCLPNMPKTYISRLVFDRRHRSVVIQRKNGKVLAGITYRPFHEKKFAEIAFCAVAQTLQVSGFGTRLMNWTKYYAREHDAMEYFLTYADNAAVGYFAKQGFTKFQSMPKERWYGYIKDYDGGTLMECYIHPTLPYNNIPDMIETQKSYLEEDVQEMSKASVVYPGLNYWNSDNGNVRVELKDIPGVIEAGWTPESHAASHPTFQIRMDGKIMESTIENMKALQLRLLDIIAKEQISWPFLEPVNVAEVPNYLDLVKDPIDISTIRKAVEAGNKYITMDIFAADVARIFKNAKIFNGQESMYYKYAHKLSGIFNQALSDSLVYNMH